MEKEDWSIREVFLHDYLVWLKYRHYIHRIPKIQKAFGLFDKEGKMQGVIAFNNVPSEMNHGKCLFKEYRVKGFNLTRLIVEDGLPKNTLSHFVSLALKQLPRPCFVVSYADAGNGHQGYIYQATNFLYTGKTQEKHRYVKGDEWLHGRSFSLKYGSCSKETIKRLGYERVLEERKHRYLLFIGSKVERKRMLRELKYPILPYPKGENTRYDSSALIPTTSQMAI